MKTNRKYNITLRSQLGPKSGTLQIKEAKVNVFGVLDVLGHENVLVGRKGKDEFTLSLKGRIRTPLGISKCEVQGGMTEEGFDGRIIIEDKTYEMTGKREKM
ncbi:MAG: hypothetical protein RR361_05680 [Anaerovorax sp.]